MQQIKVWAFKGKKKILTWDGIWYKNANFPSLQSYATSQLPDFQAIGPAPTFISHEPTPLIPHKQMWFFNEEKTTDNIGTSEFFLVWYCFAYWEKGWDAS